MSGGILLVDSLMLKWPKANAEKIRSEIIKRANKHKIDGPGAQEAFDYLNELVINGSIVSRPKPLTPFQKMSQCKTTNDIAKVYSELKNIEKTNPGLKLFYDIEFNHALDRLMKENISVPRNFINRLINNSKSIDDLKDIQTLVDSYGTQEQKNKLTKALNKHMNDIKMRSNALNQAENASKRLLDKGKSPIKSAKDSWHIFSDNGMIPKTASKESILPINPPKPKDVENIAKETTENISENSKNIFEEGEKAARKIGKWGWIGIGAAALIAIIAAVSKSNKNKQQQQLNAVA